MSRNPFKRWLNERSLTLARGQGRARKARRRPDIEGLEIRMVPAVQSAAIIHMQDAAPLHQGAITDEVSPTTMTITSDLPTDGKITYGQPITVKVSITAANKETVNEGEVRFGLPRDINVTVPVKNGTATLTTQSIPGDPSGGPENIIVFYTDPKSARNRNPKFGPTQMAVSPTPLVSWATPKITVTSMDTTYKADAKIKFTIVGAPQFEGAPPPNGLTGAPAQVTLQRRLKDGTTWQNIGPPIDLKLDSGKGHGTVEVTARDMLPPGVPAPGDAYVRAVLITDPAGFYMAGGSDNMLTLKIT